ncbi:MAG: polysaccharide biosynthesis C-terminal domain-containing protein [Chlamydiia bacterium]|nr:polysaccharide biosynthesis C-terminal domain-containing protein [Chlamydiia bacterium]
MKSANIKRSSHHQLTRHPVASLRELFTLAFPLILTTFSASLLNLTDRFLLSHFSQDAWKACCSAMNLLYLPQLGLIIIASISQAFVGHFKGARQDKMIGPFIWQMIYFSLSTILLTYPLILIGKLYLQDIEVEKDAKIYFQVLAIANFLYPLGATLASFYTGRGKNSIVLITNFSIQVLNIFLDILLIFGIQGVLPPQGVFGAAIATVISQSTYCVILFFLFRQKRHAPFFSTNTWKLNPPLLWQGLKTGIPRSLGRTIAVGAWTIATYFLIQKGGDYLLVHSFGLTIFVILSFINDGMGQALLTFNSHTLASNTSHHFRKSLRTSLYFTGITAIILAIPLLLFPEKIIAIFIKDPLSIQSQFYLKECCFWVWIAIIGSGINRIGASLITAARDTLFYACCLTLQWITLCIPVFIGIEKLGMSPSKFFLIEGVNTGLMGVIFIIRFFKEPYRQLGSQSIRIKLYQ